MVPLAENASKLAAYNGAQSAFADFTWRAPPMAASGFVPRHNIPAAPKPVVRAGGAQADFV